MTRNRAPKSRSGHQRGSRGLAAHPAARVCPDCKGWARQYWDGAEFIIAYWCPCGASFAYADLWP